MPPDISEMSKYGAVKTDIEEVQKAIAGMDRRSDKYNTGLDPKSIEARTYDNIVFRSEHEMRIYREYVKPNVNAGIFRDMRRQVNFPLNVVNPGGFAVKIGSYRADFVAEDRENRTVVIDAKGARTPHYKRTKKHFEAQYGLRILEL